MIRTTYAEIAIAVFLVAMMVWQQRSQVPASANPQGSNRLAALTQLKQPRFAFGAVYLFCYVGAEIAIRSLLANFLMQDSTFWFDAELAGRHVAYYWVDAMVGCFIGAVLMRLFAPGRILAGVAVRVIVLISIAAHYFDATPGWAILAIDL